MQHTAPQPIESRRPATFHSRGVASPFTTPLLAGTRVRQSVRSGLELLVPNPSGGAGIYIVNWPGVLTFCHPTVHDTLLFRRLSSLPRLDPATVRQAAQDVALDGYAGHDAQASAEATRQRDQADRLLAHFLLLSSLMQLSDPAEAEAAPPERTPDFYRRAGLFLRQIAPSLGCSAEHLNTGLTAMADAFAPIGIGRDDQDARVPRLIRQLGEVNAGLSDWLASYVQHDGGGIGNTLTDAIQLTTDAATAVLAGTRTALADPVTLIRRWIAQPDEPLGNALRCEYVLDGWEPIALLWSTATSVPSRRAALLQMAQVLPVLPQEVHAWTNSLAMPDLADRSFRVTSQNDTWRRGGRALALIQRNESLRALCS